MDFPWLQPEFSPTRVALGLGLLAYLVVLEPLLGMRSFAYLRTHRSKDARALPRVYFRTPAIVAGWLVVVALILLVPPDLEQAITRTYCLSQRPSAGWLGSWRSVQA